MVYRYGKYTRLLCFFRGLAVFEDGRHIFSAQSVSVWMTGTTDFPVRVKRTGIFAFINKPA